MRVIQITDDDAKQLLDSLELAKWRGPPRIESDAFEVAERERKAMIESCHRHFHFYVTTWLQKHGARGTQ